MTRLFLALIWRTLGQGRYVLSGCWCLLCGVQLVIVGQASAIEEQQSFGRLTERFPRWRRALFGPPHAQKPRQLQQRTDSRRKVADERT